MGMEGSRGVLLAFEPVLVPAPAHPDRWFEGVVSAPVRVMPEAPKVRAAVVPEPGRGSGPVPDVEEEPYTPAPARSQAGCSGEWEDTWLWEMCREREEDVVQGAGDGWLAGL